MELMLGWPGTEIPNSVSIPITRETLTTSPYGLASSDRFLAEADAGLLEAELVEEIVTSRIVVEIQSESLLQEN